jgi:hypothetical protein
MVSRRTVFLKPLGERTVPRIAAALAVVLLIGLSIGLNIVRYPTVWTMVCTSGESSQPEETAHPEAVTETAELEPQTEKSDSRQAPTATSVSSSEAKESEDPVDMQEPIENLTADDGYAPFGSGRVPDTAEVRRLPTVDSTTAEAYVPRVSDGPIPFYPNTGL